MGYVFVMAFSYVLGSSSMAFYLSRLRKTDIRSLGTGNLGASNTTILLGWWAGILVALHDIGKAALAVLLAKLLFPTLPFIGIVAGVSSVLGHIFPFYLKFRGGKGFASFWGMTLALNWKLAFAIAVIALLITLITDYIALATTATAVLVPIHLSFAERSFVPLLIILIASSVVVFKHRDNYRRIFRGEEIGLRSTMKGEKRIK